MQKKQRVANDRRESLASEPLSRKILLTALPIAGQNLISFASSFIDSLMVAPLGGESVGGVYAGSEIQRLLRYFLIGTESAVLISGSAAIGKGNRHEARKIGIWGIIIATSVALAVALLSILLPKQILSIFSSEEKTIEAGAIYLGVSAFSFPIFCLSETIVSADRCLGGKGAGPVSSSISLAVAVVLDLALIGGKLGAPSLGVRGAAISAVISRAAGLLSLFVLFLARWFIRRRRTKLHTAAPLSAEVTGGKLGNAAENQTNAKSGEGNYEPQSKVAASNYTKDAVAPSHSQNGENPARGEGELKSHPKAENTRKNKAEESQKHDTPRHHSALTALLRASLPTVSAQMVWGAYMMLSAAIMTGLSGSGAAAAGIAAAAYNLAMAPTAGYTAALSMLAGRASGSGDYGMLYRTRRTAERLSLAIGATVAFFCAVLSRPFISLFSPTEDTSSAAAGLITILVFTLPLSAYESPALYGVLRGAGQAPFVLKVDLIVLFGIVLPAALLASDLGASAATVYLILRSEAVIKAAVAAVRLRISLPKRE